MCSDNPSLRNALQNITLAAKSAKCTYRFLLRTTVYLTTKNTLSSFDS